MEDTGVQIDFHKITLGNLIQIAVVIGTFFIFWSKFESRVSVVENNVQWLVKVTASRYSLPSPESK